MTQPRASRTRWLAPGLFAGFSLLYAFTSGAFVHWLDSGELALAGATWGIPHPPGHPGYVAVSHGATLLPLGSVAFRTALVSALWASGAVVLVYLLGRRLAAQASGRRAATDADAVTAAALAAVFGVCAALWLNAVRAEVYTMQVCCALAAVVLALRWEASPDHPAPLRWAALCAGVGLINHHYLMVLTVPALLAVVLGRSDLRKAFAGQWAWVLGLGALPLLAYAALPLRAATEPVLNFGDPSTLERFWAVLTAQQFQGSVTPSNVSVLANVGTALQMTIRAIGLPTVALGLIGMAVVVWRRRLVGIALLVGVVANLASKVVMDLDPQNPDADGYLLLTYGLIAALAAAGAAFMHARIQAPGGRVASAVGVATVVFAAGMSVPGAFARSNLAETHGTAGLDAVLNGRMLPGAVALTSFYTLHFNREWFGTVEGYRSDVGALQMGLDARVDGGRSLDRWVQRHLPRARPLTEAFVAAGDGSWPVETAKALANRLPLYMEPTLSAPLGPRWVSYASVYQRVRPANMPSRPRLAQQADDLAHLSAVLRAEVRRLPEPRKMTMLLLLQLAIQRIQHLDGSGALMVLEMVQHTSPANPYGKRLQPLATQLFEALRARDQKRFRELANTVAKTDFTRLLFGVR